MKILAKGVAVYPTYVLAENFLTLKEQLNAISFLKDIRLNIAIEQDNMSFLKLKVKVRHKIVADGLNDDTFDVTNKGIHVNAEQFNDLIEDFLLKETTNKFEVLFSQRLIYTHLFAIILSLGVATFFHAKSFMIEWKNSLKQETTQQQSVAKTESAKFETLKSQIDLEKIRTHFRTSKKSKGHKDSN